MTQEHKLIKANEHWKDWASVFMEWKMQSGWFEAKTFTPGRTAELPSPQGEAPRLHQWMGFWPCKEPSAVCQLIKLETAAASSNMEVSYAQQVARKQVVLVWVPPESHPEIRILGHVIYLGDAFKRRME